MKERIEALAEIEKEYQQLFLELERLIVEKNNVIAQTQERVKAINEFYDAIEQLPRLKEIIANPPKEVSNVDFAEKR